MTVDTTKGFIPSPNSPVEGLNIRLNPKNGFLVFELHYSADPKKRDPEYRDKIKSSMPLADYLQEYELQWDSFSGQPVYRDFSRKFHVSSESLDAEVGLPLYRCWDWGLTPACVVFQVQSDRLLVLWESQEFNMGAKRFAEQTLRALKLKFPEWTNPKTDWIDCGDPSGAFRKDTDENTCFRIMQKDFGITVLPGAIAWEARKSSIDDWLRKFTSQGPAFQISGPDCPLLVRGFSGGYRYPERVAEIEPAQLRPIKDENSHLQDALQMGTTRLLLTNTTKSAPIKSPGYGFGRQKTRSKSLWPA